MPVVSESLPVCTLSMSWNFDLPAGAHAECPERNSSLVLRQGLPQSGRSLPEPPQMQSHAMEYWQVLAWVIFIDSY